MPPALMITPSTSVRFQYSRHHAMSYCKGSFSVMLVCPQRATRRYQGLFGDAVCPGDIQAQSASRFAGRTADTASPTAVVSMLLLVQSGVKGMNHDSATGKAHRSTEKHRSRGRIKG